MKPTKSSAADFDALAAQLAEAQTIIADANNRDMIVLRAKNATLEADLATARERLAECERERDLMLARWPTEEKPVVSITTTGSNPAHAGKEG
jgi:hypothetical protein